LYRKKSNRRRLGRDDTVVHAAVTVVVRVVIFLYASVGGRAMDDTVRFVLCACVKRNDGVRHVVQGSSETSRGFENRLPNTRRDEKKVVSRACFCVRRVKQI